MKKYLSYFLICSSLLLLCQSFTFGQPLADKFLKRVYIFEEGKIDSIQYRLFVPKYSGNSIKYPLILTLHGSSGIGLDNLYHITGRNALTWAEDSAQQKNPAFVFAPQIQPAINVKEYCTKVFFQRINEIIDLLITEYPIDTTRLYITGLSLGAIETWAMIYAIKPELKPERFAAALPMCGFWDFDFEPKITKIPVWNFHGVLDDMVPVSKSREMMKAIENAGIKVAYIHSQIGNAGLTNSGLDSLWAAGVNHIYTEFTDEGHAIADKTYDLPILHRWLFAQRKVIFPVGFKPEPSAIPGANKLYDCYPNPFNPTTNIEFRIANSGFVSLKIFDLFGKEVATLINEEKTPGEYKIQFNGSNLASGVYFYQLKAGNFISTKQFVLLK